ncbi:hypothetical protein QTH97_27775 [Variovorax sp. J22R24]|uniref:hypothetical protein n=1 Tax=Variovorax gracilis TaxID=3053502 RepID=UPI002574F5EE|nr:hypothetical protein [Variovorax sp. J22R24]MDM0108771.1 hypothetical protein [Variovorax sp. J22R24]
MKKRKPIEPRPDPYSTWMRPAATSADALRFIRNAQSVFTHYEPTPENRERLLKYVSQAKPAWLRMLSRRIMIDIGEGRQPDAADFEHRAPGKKAR